MAPKHRSSTLITAAVSAVIAVIVSVGAPALANHQWSDVPTGDFFHESIDNFTTAGCASGFADGTFRGNDPVKRQQMARFINSCGGRLSYAEGSVGAVTTSAATIATAPMLSGAVASGGGIVLATATFRVSSLSTTGFPCEISFELDGNTVFLDLPANTADAIEDASGSIQTSFDLPAGSNSNLALTVKKAIPCAATVFASAQLSSTYYPFDGAGNGGAESVPERIAVPDAEPGRP